MDRSILTSLVDTPFPHNLKIAGSNPLQFVTPTTEHKPPLPFPLHLPWLLLCHVSGKKLSQFSIPSPLTDESKKCHFSLTKHDYVDKLCKNFCCIRIRTIGYGSSAPYLDKIEPSDSTTVDNLPVVGGDTLQLQHLPYIKRIFQFSMRHRDVLTLSRWCGSASEWIRTNPDPKVPVRTPVTVWIHIWHQQKCVTIHDTAKILCCVSIFNGCGKQRTLRSRQLCGTGFSTVLYIIVEPLFRVSKKYWTISVAHRPHLYTPNNSLYKCFIKLLVYTDTVEYRDETKRSS